MLRLHAEDGEEHARDVRSDHRLWNWTAGQDEAGATVERHLLERVALTHEIGEVRGRHGLAPASRTQFADERQPFGLVER
jgi:hypothetical protein